MTQTRTSLSWLSFVKEGKTGTSKGIVERHDKVESRAKRRERKKKGVRRLNSLCFCRGRVGESHSRCPTPNPVVCSPLSVSLRRKRRNSRQLTASQPGLGFSVSFAASTLFHFRLYRGAYANRCRQSRLPCFFQPGTATQTHPSSQYTAPADPPLRFNLLLRPYLALLSFRQHPSPFAIVSLPFTRT